MLFLRRVLFFYFGTTLDYSIGGGDTIVIDTIEDSREHAEKTYEDCGGLFPMKGDNLGASYQHSRNEDIYCAPLSPLLSR